MERKEILEKLAKKEISSEEAERLLNESKAKSPDGPVFEETYGDTPAKNNRGCLMAIILVVLLGIFLLFGGFCFIMPYQTTVKEMRRNVVRQEIQEIGNRITSGKPQVSTREGGSGGQGGMQIIVQETSSKDITGEKVEEKVMTEEERKAEIEKIHKMIKDKKITEEEGKRLIKALEDSRKTEEPH